MKPKPKFQANLKTKFTLLVFKYAKTKLHQAIGNSLNCPLIPHKNLGQTLTLREISRFKQIP